MDGSGLVTDLTICFGNFIAIIDDFVERTLKVCLGKKNNFIFLMEGAGFPNLIIFF